MHSSYWNETLARQILQRKNSYVCYVVPIVSYGSYLWKPSKATYHYSKVFNEKQCVGSPKPATVFSHARTNFRKATSCHCLYIKNFMLCYYLQKFYLEKLILTGKAMLLSLRCAPGESKSLEISYASKCGCRRVNQIFGAEPVTLLICSMIVSNMMCFLIQITKANSWNCTNDSSYPDTTNQTLAFGVFCVASITLRDLKKLIFT